LGNIALKVLSAGSAALIGRDRPGANLAAGKVAELPMRFQVPGPAAGGAEQPAAEGMPQLPSGALLETRILPAVADVEELDAVAGCIKRPELARSVAAVVEGIRLVLDRAHEERIDAPSGAALDARKPAVERLRHVGSPAAADETLRPVRQELPPALERKSVVESQLRVPLQKIDPCRVDRAFRRLDAVRPRADQLAEEAQVRAGPQVGRGHGAQPAITVVGRFGTAPEIVAVGFMAHARLHAERRGRHLCRDRRRTQACESEDAAFPHGICRDTLLRASAQ
jgi:hypothetical protein